MCVWYIPVAVWCSVVQCGAVWCSVVQCGAVWCSVVHILVQFFEPDMMTLCVRLVHDSLMRADRQPSLLQCVAACCSVLQCVRDISLMCAGR